MSELEKLIPGVVTNKKNNLDYTAPSPSAEACACCAAASYAQGRNEQENGVCTHHVTMPMTPFLMES